MAYTQRLSEVAASNPLLLVAYAQTMYVALLAGGQSMAAFMRTARGLVKGEGDAIFSFAAIPAAEQRQFRAALRAAVDALGEQLTGALTRCCALCWSRAHVGLSQTLSAPRC